jgi:rhodanese-related sulfurtransferase
MQVKFLHRLGAATLILCAAILILMGKPSKLTPLTHMEDLGTLAMYGEDRIQPYTLADWIISGSGDFQVIDLRGAEDFNDYHIESALSIPFTSLLTQDGLGRLPKYKKIVLYCGDGSRAAQAWTVLRSKGFEAYILQGGLKGWFRQIMTPVDPGGLDLTDIDIQEFSKKLKTMREHFTGTSAELGILSEQSAEPPPPPPVTNAPAKKKKSGGC